MASKDRKKLKPNIIVQFWGNYIDDNGEKAKSRRHLLIEERGDYLFFMKFTSQEEDKKREKLGQVRCLIKIEPKFVECLDMISYPVFNRKVKISLTDLKATNYRHFYICSLHSNGCLKPRKFTEVCQKFKEAWEDKTEPEVIKSVILLKASELKPTKGLLWWVEWVETLGDTALNYKIFVFDTLFSYLQLSSLLYWWLFGF